MNQLPFLSSLLQCQACRLHCTRTQVVPGEGNIQVKTVMVGEGPGADEDQSGRPFVGQTGTLLRNTLVSVGFPMDEVFITNVVKCRPPGNRDPEMDELTACNHWTALILDLIKPKLVVTVGRISTKALGTMLGVSEVTNIGILKVAGKAFQHDNGPILYPITHPSWVSRTGEHQWFKDQLAALTVLHRSL
jgi:uracil-DNA glycosylase family 4